MGYSTWFDGSFSFDKPVSVALKIYINKFSRIRHMKRDVNKIMKSYPGLNISDLGVEGEYFVNGSCKDENIIDYNEPPSTQPGLWCQWIINDNNELVWDGAEKFYNYIEWLEYLINNFFAPYGYKLNGRVEWHGDDSTDIGVIKVKNNKVTVKYGSISYR